MKLIALLSWYAENPAWLAACVASLEKAGVDHLIAVDGAYMLFPSGKAKSAPIEHAAVVETAHALGLGLTMHTPQTTFTGNEVEKRSLLFELAEQVAKPGDWYMVMDADQVITEAPADLKARLERTELDVAEVTFYETNDQGNPHLPPEHRYPVPILFRALPGLRVQGNHYTYALPDGRLLWGQGVPGREIAEALSVPDVRVLHRNQHRHPDRTRDRHAYYRRRDELRIETAPCFLCHETDGEHVEPCDFNVIDGELQAGSCTVCPACLPTMRDRNAARLRYLGHDPATVIRANGSRLAVPTR